MGGRSTDRAGRTPGDVSGGSQEPQEPTDGQVDGDGTWTTQPFPGVFTGKPVKR